MFLALVAQLDRVLPSEGKGREFESRQVRHIKISTVWVGIFICCTRWDENSRSDVRIRSRRRSMRRSEARGRGVLPRATSPSTNWQVNKITNFFEKYI